MLLPPPLALTALAAISVSASPVPRAPPTITAADIIRIAPSTGSCTNAPADAPAECRTASQAAPYIALSFLNYDISSFGEQAALLALILYESGDFQYSETHFPAVPGQGTRNMQSPKFNLQYAQFLANQCANCGVTASDVTEAEGTGAASVLDLVNTDEWGFGSAAWFLSTQCSASIRSGLATGSEAAWNAYLTECIGTTATADRTSVWQKTIALGHW